MRDDLLIENKKITLQSIRYAVVSSIIGSVSFILLDMLPITTGEWIWISIPTTIFLAIFASIFSLPFSIVGGYALGWLLQKTQWHNQGSVKAVISGTIGASITLVVIFVIGEFLLSCLGSHGDCQTDFWEFIKRLVVNELSSSGVTKAGHLFWSRFSLALPIAAICGGITGWRLSRLAKKANLQQDCCSREYIG